MKTMYIKIFIILMFATGLLQWSIFDIKWEYFATIQAIHIIGSVVVSIFLIIPFVNKHTYKYLVIEKINSISGWLLGFTLLLSTISGFYLFLVGNRGGDALGIYSFNIHLYGSFFLIFFFLYHVKKQNTSPNMPVIIFASILSTLYPTVSYSDVGKLTLMKLENNVSKYHNEEWTNSAKCKTCHSDIFDQWADSNHKNLVASNPYYMVMEGIAAEVEGEEFRKWCMGCHNPSALTTGLEKTGHAMDGNFLANEIFERGAKTLVDELKTYGNSRLEEGISCIACHRITDAKSKGNGSYTLDLTNRKKYAFEDSKSNLTQWLSEKFINSKPNIHKKSYSNPLYKKSSYCASCHDETSPTTGAKIVSTFKEWEKSSFNNPNNPKEHKTCIDCHMTYLKEGEFSPLKGRSTDGGKIKKDIKVHYFSGSNHFLSGLKSKKHENQILQLLRTSAELDVEIKNAQIHVGVKNVGAGHHLPTGVADFRELWLEITVKDRDSNIVFESGKLKDDGNLGEDARPFMKVFGDKDGKPVGLLFWKYEKLLSDTRIPAGKRRVESYNIQESEKLKYPLTAVVKLNFRIYPQWVTDAVKKMYPQLPNPPVVELEKIIKKFPKK
ncbi:multiheme c-type cytochrome [Sulfurovum sp. CS9]|uniref:multiheme c-type cytochrome n=1 Tax=Sulfurovum sp. CS9 TaxID=3391146 RepID=UPI0039EA1A89